MVRLGGSDVDNGRRGRDVCVGGWAMLCRSTWACVGLEGSGSSEDVGGWVGGAHVGRGGCVRVAALML